MYPAASLFSRLRVGANLAGAVSDIAGQILNPAGAWRPPEWSRGALTAITVPATEGGDAQVYVFDAVFRIEHERELRRTEHPIQPPPGAAVAAITDHAFLLPARVTLDIGMSDAMASFADGMWDEDESKSVSAYQMLLDLQDARTLVTLTTRLDTYQNMIVESIRPSDTVQTRHGLRATVVFGEVFLAGSARGSDSTTDSAASDRPQTTNQTPSGVVQGTPPPASFRRLYQISTAGAGLAARIPGAGAWSSVARKQIGGFGG